MAYPEYIREKARSLRVDRRLSIVEIAERLALPKTTIYYWVRDLPLGRPRRENQLAATRAMQRKFRLLREEAYEEGRRTFVSLATGDPSFRSAQEQQRAAEWSQLAIEIRSAYGEDMRHPASGAAGGLDGSASRAVVRLARHGA